MTNLQAGDVRLFEIRGDGISSAVYSYHVPLPTGGNDPRAVIQNVVSAGAMPSGGSTPVRQPGNADRYLDIVESRSGRCTYAFRLNAELMGVQRLQFVRDSPFLPLPLGTGEQFLTDFETGYDGSGLWASFTCDTDAVRTSDLVRRLGGRAFRGAEFHHHPEILTIPFTFNLIDPVLNVAPWAVPRESSAQGANFYFYTHGGVHPSALSFLILEL